MNPTDTERFYEAGQRVEDPWAALGLTPPATEEAIQARFRELVRRHPPERDPEGFRRIEEARRRLTGPRRVAHRHLPGLRPLRAADVALEAAPAKQVARPVDDELFFYALCQSLPFA